jgi:hypothetical protein
MGPRIHIRDSWMVKIHEMVEGLYVLRIISSWVV